MNMAVLPPTRHSSQTDFRQLRHQTRNALAGILGQLTTGLSGHDPSRRVAAELERRVLLTVRIADCLFGLTEAPGRFEDRLSNLCASVLDLAGQPDQYLTLSCQADGEVPLQHQETVLRVAHELVGNAVKHGMHMRLLGRIDVRVAAGRTSTELDVTDDGWGCGSGPVCGEGTRIARLLAVEHCGTFGLRRDGPLTRATLCLPTKGVAAYSSL